MGSIYYGFILLPLLFFGTLIFIFQSGLTGIANQQFLQNCPYPVNGGIITISGLDNNLLNYTVTYDNATSDYHLTLVNCYIDNGAQSANTVVYTESASNWFAVGTGYLAYIMNVISQTGLKVQAFLTVLWLYVDAPAQVTNLSFFTYIQTFLLALIGFGAFMAIRSGNG